MQVRFDGVVFRRGERTVIDLPELTFASGRVTALLGPNGAGKSTLLRLIAGLEAPQAGQIWLGDRLVRPGRESHAMVAFAFQRAVFLAGSLRSNLDLALRLRGLSSVERAQRINEAAAACGIIGLLDRRASRLSGGEAQRANLARTLGLRAPVTLLDEPLAGLDGPVRRQLLRDLPRLLREFTTTAILVTHDRDEAMLLADDIVILMDGMVRAAGPRSTVFREPPDAETAAFLGYTVVPGNGEMLAIAPGALRIGRGEVRFELLAESVTDLGHGVNVMGTINGEDVSVTLDTLATTMIGPICVSAPADAVRRYPAE
jgi:ABC-type sugar transport system ATPase subunit